MEARNNESDCLHKIRFTGYSLAPGGGKTYSNSDSCRFSNLPDMGLPIKISIFRTVKKRKGEKNEKRNGNTNRKFGNGGCIGSLRGALGSVI
jgi:hypothetical protein